MSYDYIVESFFAEYKLDVDELERIKKEYNSSSDNAEREQLEISFKELYPEFVGDIGRAKIPKTVAKEMFFVQSPKGNDGLPTIHYSLNEHMLSDMRRLRGIEKRNLAQAEREKNEADIIRYNANQLAIKILMNSEYGSGNNKTFANYDPDVAAAVTWCSRSCIGYLTNILHSEILYVDEKFISDNLKDIEPLQKIGMIIFEQISIDDDFIQNRHLALRRTFDDLYDIQTSNIYKMYIKPSSVIYQDTDSNYYLNEYIINYFTENKSKFSPDIINDCMQMMLHHNNLISSFTTSSIQRRPIGMGFEGAYIICRYMPRKKKYYGVKWGYDSELRLEKRISDPRAYDSEGILIKDYSPYWHPKETVLPLPSGDYIQINQEQLLIPGVNYLDYIISQNVKCTGVDLARRDQYRFINLFHIMILQKDLMLMKYLGNNEWESLLDNISLENIIVGLMDQFQDIIRKFSGIANFVSDELPSIQFRLEDFSRSVAYKPGTRNVAAKIVSRLEKDESTRKYIPDPGTRINYVIVIDEETLTQRLKGNKGMAGLSDRGFLLDEIYDMIREKNPREEVESKLKEKRFTIDYETYINAAAILLLDFKHYIQRLGTAVSLYTIDTRFPLLTSQINDETISPEDAEKAITSAQTTIANEHLERYYPKRKRTPAVKTKTTTAKLTGGDLFAIFELSEDTIIDTNMTNEMRDKLMRQMATFKVRRDGLDKWLRLIMYNSFQGCPEGIPYEEYIKYKDNADILQKKINELDENISKLEHYEKSILRLFKL